MFAIIRRYDGVDQNRSAELTRKVNETLVPSWKSSRLRGLLADRGDNGVFSSLSLFETPEQEGVDEVRRHLVSRREARHDGPQRAEDHERQGRRSQRPRPGRRVTRPHRIRTRWGPACRAPSLRCALSTALRGSARPMARQAARQLGGQC